MLDDIDLKIIQKLTVNGRISLTDLSAGTNISRVAIASRIEKLMQSGLLHVSACLNLDKLNYQTLLVEMQVGKEKIQVFRKTIEHEPKVINSFEISGPYNFLLVCTGKNNSELQKFIENDLKKFASNCKVTLSSNPQASGFVKIKGLGGI